MLFIASLLMRQQHFFYLTLQGIGVDKKLFVLTSIVNETHLGIILILLRQIFAHFSRYYGFSTETILVPEACLPCLQLFSCLIHT